MDPQTWPSPLLVLSLGDRALLAYSFSKFSKNLRTQKPISTTFLVSLDTNWPLAASSKDLPRMDFKGEEPKMSIIQDLVERNRTQNVTATVLFFRHNLIATDYDVSNFINIFNEIVCSIYFDSSITICYLLW